MSSTERKYYLAFSVFPGIGPLRFKLLLEYFGSAKRAWQAKERELLKINLGARLTAKFSDFRKRFSIDSFSDTLKRRKINFLTVADTDYPLLLKAIADPPVVLYIRGKLSRLKEMKRKVAVVGTRKMTNYGRLAAQKIAGGLAQKNIAVVSGMARGIDTVAHLATISSKGVTIAVLGSGIDVIYPLSNTELYHKIIEKYGLVVSEYPPGQLANRTTFPARNRIISGLSEAVVVVEGRRGSGALITARYAADQGREVFAVPGPVTESSSQATSYLLKNGAQVAEEADDIIEELGFEDL